jgi:hypothetical protein
MQAAQKARSFRSNSKVKMFHRLKQFDFRIWHGNGWLAGAFASAIKTVKSAAAVSAG